MKNFALLLFSTATVVLAACRATAPTPNHFLSDYSRLEKVSSSSLRYLDRERLADYSKFYVLPVEVYYHDRARRTADWETLNELKKFTHQAIREAISDRYEMVVRDGPGVARVRVALTEVTPSYPVARLFGAAGGASLEAEIVDSVTGEQIGALVEAQKGTTMSMDSFSRYGGARGVVLDWAARFRARLDEVHGEK